jgi:beta-N-acetylhexosaminidase
MRSAGSALLAVVLVLGVEATPAAAYPQQRDEVAVVVQPTATVVGDAVDRAYAAMTPAERVGQLFMVGVRSTGSTPAERRALRRDAVGNVYLAGNTDGDVDDVARVVRRAGRAATTHRVEPFVSVDQEGGLVQRLKGPGFSRMPTALEQGRRSPADLRAASRRWAEQLDAARVSVNLAPVADVVPRRGARRNAPIGAHDRQLGHTVRRVTSRSAAFVRGMQDGGVAATLKHFPGLGRATANTDHARGVTDPTSRHDRYVRPFARGVRAGASFVMVSSATYPRIDARRPACFSPVVLRGMLRDDLGFDGVVVSDDFEAVATSRVPAPRRATRFLAAGGTMVLVTSTRSVGAMTRAVLRRARTDERFAARVEAAVRLVLATKASAGLLADRQG